MRRRALPLLLIAALLVTGLLSGCARVRAALAVQPDDTVTGEVVAATPETSPQDPGPPIKLPPALESEVDVTPYRQDGYAGSVLRFDGLSFDQLGELAKALGPTPESVVIGLRRAGNRVVVDGSVDLKTVTVDKADFQLKIGFPGEVLESNGESDGDETSWSFPAGEVGDVRAVVAFDDPNAPSPVNWTLGLAAVVVLAAGAVVVYARRTRNPPLSQQR